MIKIYGNGCQQCRQLKFLAEKSSLDTEYIEVKTAEQQDDLVKIYEVISFPIVVKDGEVIRFDECLELFARARKG